MVTRMRRMLQHFALVAGLGAATACASAVPLPTAPDATWALRRWPETSLQSLSDGRALYVARCAGCHALIPPSRRSGDRWLEQVPLMAQRARLKDAEKTLITRYLLTSSRAQDAQLR